MTINLIGLLWSCSFVYPILVACGRMVKTSRDTNEKHGKDCTKDGFYLARAKLDRIGAGCSESMGGGANIKMKNWN